LNEVSLGEVTGGDKNVGPDPSTELVSAIVLRRIVKAFVQPLRHGKHRKISYLKRRRLIGFARVISGREQRGHAYRKQLRG
jgi:hypothetical protein